ncbi:uncharacterized protein [Dysidea avara]|uniref:uncharacterized protein n=1 Tax=Dysidea avara TaxID=196820 RepID=UPI00331CE6F8
MTSENTSDSIEATRSGLLTPRYHLQEDQDYSKRCSCGCTGWCGQYCGRCFVRCVMAKPKLFRRFYYGFSIISFIGWVIYIAGFTFDREWDTDESSPSVSRSSFLLWVVAIEGGVSFGVILLTLFFHNMVAMAISFILSLIYLTSMGGVLNDNGNWLYDHPGVSSTDQSAIVTELSGLILSAIFTITSLTILLVSGLYFSNRREQEMSQYTFLT